MAYNGENIPLYRKVYETLQERIRAGDYSIGSAIPSESKLREEFGVSLITIRRAIHELALDGLIESRQGIGNIVRDAATNAIVVGMTSFTSDVAAGRLRLVRTLMVDNMAPAPTEVAEKLGVQPVSMLRHLIRLDCEGGMPFGTDEVFVPPIMAGSITTEIAASPLFMHLWQEAAGIELVQTSYDLWVEMPNDQDKKLLQTGQDVPMLVTGELVFDKNNIPCGWIESRYRGDRTRLSTTVMLVQRKTEHGIVGE